MRGAGTKAMSDIVEERQQSRCPPAAAPLRAAARRPAGFVARSSHTAPGIARRSRLASGPGGPAAKWEVISARALRGAKADDVVLVAPMQQHRQSGRSQLQNSREFPAQLEIASLPFGYFFDLSSGATATLPINPIAGKQVEGLASGLLDGLRY